MPGSFWGGPPRNNSKPLRRRRSLLGRKIHSENDLPEQDTSTSASTTSQQHQYSQHHTTLVLPENVKTILIAGTPECWNLTTTPYSPTAATANTSLNSSSSHGCDASLVTLGSEFGPSTTRTIDEEEPYEEGGGLNWLLQTNPKANVKRPAGSSPSSCLIQGRRKGATRPQQQGEASICSTEQEQQEQKEPGSMVVMYRNTPPLPPPQQALYLWLSSAEALIQSNEMSSFWGSTQDVIKMAGGMAVRTACLPVTLPLHVACATKDFVGWTLHQTISQTAGVIRQLTDHNSNKSLDNSSKSQQPLTDTANNNDAEQGESVAHHNNNPLQDIFHLVPVVLEVAGKIKDEIGASVVGIVMPPNHQNRATEATDQDEKERLDRLRLPVYLEDNQKKTLSHCQSLPVAPVSVPVPTVCVTPADYSKYLMRVEDLGLAVSADKTAKVLFIDLSVEYRDKTLVKKSLERLATQGLSLASTHAPVVPPATPTSPPDVEWKPEGSTAKLLRKKKLQTLERWEEIMQSDILMWSGSFRKNCGGSPTHSQHPLFLARGTVPNKCPRDFLEMIWDNRRTSEYNAYCAGRENMLQIDDKVLSSQQVHTGTKVVKSETRVPFTGLSVTLCTMMHCCPLPGGPQEGYMIVSRSLVSGMAGSHVSQSSPRNIDKPKSEILWGVNVFRSVSGHPGQTELTSLSQVASAMVPKFLSQKIGVMGVEDFFRNVRKANPKIASSSPESPSLNASPSSLRV